MSTVNPRLPPVSDTNFSSPAWQRFFHDLFTRVVGAGMIAWTQISTVGSNLTDLTTRNHNDLQNIQGGSATEEYHLTAADYAGLGTGLVVRQSTVSLFPTVPSATTVDIFGAAGATISLTGTTTTTTITNCTDAQVGSAKRIITAGAWPVTASASLTIDGATSGTTTYPAGAEIEIKALTTSTFAIRTVYATGTWTPNQGAGLTVVGAFSSSGTYTIRDSLVKLTALYQGATSVAASAGGIMSTNIPFASKADTIYLGVALKLSVNASSHLRTTTADPSYLRAVEAIAATTPIYCDLTYIKA